MAAQQERPMSAGSATPGRGWALFCTAIVSRAAVLCTVVCCAGTASEPPAPVLQAVFPPGGKAGTTVTVAVGGSTLEGLSALRFGQPAISATKGEGNTF